MPISARDVIDRLQEFPHRGAGTENESLARESLMALLATETDVETVDEAFYAPQTYLRFFWVVTIGIVIAVWAYPLVPAFFTLIALGLFLSLGWFLDWRQMPLVWVGAKTLTSNLVAEKARADQVQENRTHRPLVILMAHLDSAPAAFAYRDTQVKNFSRSFWGGLVLMAVPALVLTLGLFIGGVSLVWQIIASFCVLVTTVMASIDFWKFGFVQGGNDNGSGVAAVLEAASSMWNGPDMGADIRLLLTSAEEAGMLGAQHYLNSHNDELKSRPVYVVNIDTVGAGELRYVETSGAITRSSYDNVLTDAAFALGLGGMHHEVGDFDSVWFNRKNIPAITLAAYDENGLMPHIHTPDDKFDTVDPASVTQAAEMAVKLITLALKQDRI